MSVAEVLRLHHAAAGAYLLLIELGAAVKNGPMFTGRVHGPWRPTDQEWPWVWGDLAGEPGRFWAGVRA